MISFGMEPRQMIGNNIVEKDYDLMQIVEIYLAKEKNEYGIMEVLGELLLSNDPIEKKKEILAGYGIEMDSELENEVTEMEGFGQFIEDRGFEKGMIKSKEIGIAEGKAQGIAEGKVKGKLLLIQQLMKTQKLTMEEAMVLIGLNEDEKKEIRTISEN